jgi:DNA repair protein RecN (Recombination protein N)
MLAELYIRNFAIIDELRLNFAAGFNVLTGETGAGKSIILDAVTLVLGGRADTTMVRAGREQAYVEATFELDARLQKELAPALAEEALENEEAADVLILAREVRLNGRNVTRINGRAVTLTLLRQIAEPLIDIYGQGEHLSLRRPRAHLPLLDAYAGLEEERRAFAKEMAAYQKLEAELARLRRDERTLAQRMDMLQFQIKEIDAANLAPGEEDELRTERERLANAEQLTRAAGTAVTLLTGVELEGEEQSIVDLMGEAERALSQLARYDSSQEERLQTLQGLSFQINELAADLGEYLETLEFNPDRLDFIEERLELINRLKRKYGPDIPAILQLRDEAATELEQITHSEERIEALSRRREADRSRLGKMALALSQQRKQGAERLARAVETQLADLNMAGARFAVDFHYEPDEEDGVYVDGNAYACDKSGVDRAEFLISTNPGEPLKPMARVASGGETARLMLALKTALAQVDETPTLIFDEIDQGIGGRVGDVVGQKLWGLTAVGGHQVIVVTHLPQLAGYGDRHFHVSKQRADGRTVTAVSPLDRSGRVSELAAMLGTQEQLARRGAAAILDQAHGAKEKLTPAAKKVAP